MQFLYEKLIVYQAVLEKLFSQHNRIKSGCYITNLLWEIFFGNKPLKSLLCRESKSLFKLRPVILA